MSPIVLTLGGDASPFIASSVILQVKPVIRHQDGRHESRDTEKGPRERNSQLRQGDVREREPRGADLAGAERILPVSGSSPRIQTHRLRCSHRQRPRGPTAGWGSPSPPPTAPRRLRRPHRRLRDKYTNSSRAAHGGVLQRQEKRDER